MNQVLMILLLALGAHHSSAVGLPELNPVVAAQQGPQSPASAVDGVLGLERLSLITGTIEKSPFYTNLVMEDSAVPIRTRNLKYLILLNEVHEAHRTLESLLVEMKKNNSLLERQWSTQGTHYG